MVPNNVLSTPLPPAQPFPFTTLFRSAGNITLTNVLVVNNQPASNTSVFGPVTLFPGQVTNFTGSYLVPLDSCGPYLDVLTATANDKCFGHAVTNTATANCAATNHPPTLVTKSRPLAPGRPGQ